jgi:hypothetical protein
VYSLYVDTSDYLADTIISDVCLEIEILEEKRVVLNNGNQYILVYVRYNRQQSDDKFRKFVNILKYNMVFNGNDSYLKDCKSILEGLNKYEVFGGNWG